MAGKVALLLEYDGTRYCGFQWQPGQPTIQGEVEKAIGRLTGEVLRVVAAGRTDTGVHARGQVVSFRTGSALPERTIVQGLNYYLPKDIAVKTACRVADTFHVQRDAVSREYHYSVLVSRTPSPLQEKFCYRVGPPLDTGAMNQVCRGLVGERDFLAFASALEVGKVYKTVRRMDRAEVIVAGDMAVLVMVASSFLPHQVRNTAGALLRVGRGEMTVTEFDSIIETHQPGMAGPAAPPRGLCLSRVNYPNLDMEKCSENL